MKWHNLLKDHTSSQMEFHWWEVISQQWMNSGDLLENELMRGERILFPMEQGTQKPTTELSYSRVRRCVFLRVRARSMVFETHTIH